MLPGTLPATKAPKFFRGVVVQARAAAAPFPERVVTMLFGGRCIYIYIYIIYPLYVFIERKTQFLNECAADGGRVSVFAPAEEIKTKRKENEPSMSVDHKS